MGNAFAIGRSGLLAAQRALDATAHNVANAGTEFFMKNNIDFNEQRFDVVGNGVIADINQGENKLPIGILDDISDSEANKVKSDLMNKLGSVLDQSDITGNLNKFFNSWGDLSANPNVSAVRQKVLQSVDGISSSLNGIDTQTAKLTNDLNYENKVDVQEFNSLLTQLNAINNSSSYEITSGQKQNILNKLNEIASVTTTDNGNNIYLKTESGLGKQIIGGGSFNPLSINDFKNTKGGRIGGRLDFANNVMPQMKAEISNGLEPIFNNINTQHKNGFDADASSGKDIFTWNSGDVYSIKNNLTDIKEIAASSTNIVNSNGNNANSMYQMGNVEGINVAQLVGLEKSKIAGMKEAYQNISNTLGGGVSAALTKWNSQFGVNLDEEAINAMKFQRMYEANAKLIKTADEMLGTLLNIRA